MWVYTYVVIYLRDIYLYGYVAMGYIPIWLYTKGIYAYMVIYLRDIYLRGYIPKGIYL